MVKACIGLGSNLGDRKAILNQAVKEIGALPGTRVLLCSSWLENPALDIENGPDFLNGVVEIETELPPRELLARLQAIEVRHGRDRSPAAQAQGCRSRTLDLDILLYGTLRMEEDGLIIPHPRMMEREFVLLPLSELGIEISQGG